MSTSPPFACHSPLPRRVLGTDLNISHSSSDSNLLSSIASPPPTPPSQPKRVKPFILRSSSPHSTSSSTVSAKANPPSLPSSSTMPQLPFTSSSNSSFRTVSPERPLASRKPPVRLSSRTTSRLPKVASAVARATSVLNVREAEDNGNSPGFNKEVGYGGSSKSSGRGISRDGDSSGSEMQEDSARRRRRQEGSLGDMTNGVVHLKRGRRPVESSASPMRTPTRASASTTRSQTTSPARPPRPATRSSVSPEKKKKYAEMRQVLTVRSVMAEGNYVVGSAEEEAYSSMQDLLESSGFTDTRVVTPNAAGRRPPYQRHSKQPSSSNSTSSSAIFPTSESTTSLVTAQSRPTLKHKPSLLSLAISSIWPSSSRAPSITSSSATPASIPSEENAPSPDRENSGDDSDSTVNFSRRNRAREWVIDVARETSCSPPISSTSFVYPSRLASFSPTSTLFSSPSTLFSSPNLDTFSPGTTYVPSIVSPVAPSEFETPRVVRRSPPSRKSSFSPTQITPRKSPSPTTSLTPDFANLVCDSASSSSWTDTHPNCRSLRHAVSSPTLTSSSLEANTYQSFGLAPPPSPLMTNSIGLGLGEMQYGEMEESPERPKNHSQFSVERSRGLGFGWTKSLWSLPYEFSQAAQTTLKSRTSVTILGWGPANLEKPVEAKVEDDDKAVPKMLRKKSRLLRPGGALKPVLTTTGGILADDW